MLHVADAGAEVDETAHREDMTNNGGDREGYLSAGITDYLSKPIEVPLLLEALSRAAMATGKA